jgi:hypothetical protein
LVICLPAIPGQLICKEKTRGFRNWSSQTLVQSIFCLIGLQQGKLQGILVVPPC